MKTPLKRPARIVAALALKLCLFSLLIGQGPKPSATSTIEEVQIPAPSLAGNVLGDPATQQVFIYLPPSYKSETAKRFPTLYLLHGYSGRPEEWVKGGYQGMTLQSEMDSLIAKGVAADMIVIVPNGRNAYLGGFYTNSDVTGNWEDYLYRDVVNYVDEKYRTLAKPASRGIAGHSMGGYGAFMLAMKHPDVFGSLYSLSPCCVGLEGDLTGDNPAWAKAAKVTTRDIFAKPPQSFEDFWTKALVALSAAFAPNARKSPLFADYPFIDKEGLLTRNESAFASFRTKMPLYLIEQYRGNLMKLRGIFLDVGEFDEFTHIRRGTAKLSTELSEREIPHSFEIYKGGDHGNKIRERFDTRVIPFFSSVLEK